MTAPNVEKDKTDFEKATKIKVGEIIYSISPSDVCENLYFDGNQSPDSEEG